MSAARRPLLVQQSYDKIRTLIEEGNYGESGQLPSETILAAELNVSRATVRTALTRLEYDGFIMRIHGKGTFVKEKTIKLETRQKEKWDFIPMLEESGRKVTVELLGIKSYPAGEEESRLLKTGRSTEVVELLRLYRADERPVIYSRNIFPRSLLLRNVDPVLMDFQCTAYELFKHYFREQAESSRTDLIPALPNKNIADALNIPRETPLFLFKDFFLTSSRRILLAGENYMNDKLVSLSFLSPKNC